MMRCSVVDDDGHDGEVEHKAEDDHCDGERERLTGDAAAHGQHGCRAQDGERNEHANQRNQAGTDQRAVCSRSVLVVANRRIAWSSKLHTKERQA
jgi:hypothetical protein